MKSFFLESNKVIIIFFIFLALLTITLYFSNLTAHFVSDDFGLIITSQNRNPLTFFITSSQSQTNSGNYSPLINLIFNFSFYLSGLNPLPYHLISLFFHFGNIILLYFIAKKLISKKVALLACLFFSVYFNNSEAVAWIAAISHVVSTFFYLFSIFLWLKFLDNKKLSVYFISLISFFLALLAKEIAISLPLVIVIIYFIQKMRGKTKDYKNQFIFFWFFYIVLLFFYLFLRYYNTGIIFGYSQNSFDFNLRQYFRNFFYFLASLFLTNQWRVWLIALIKNHFKEIYLSFTFFVILLGVALRKSFFVFVLSVLLFGIILGPYLFLSMNPLSNEGERYLYLPVIVLLLFLTSLLVKLKERFPKLILLVIILGVFGSAYLLYEKNKVWRQSGEISEKIITDFSQQVDLTKKNEGVVFLYLPDNLSGAQIFRNAIREAIKFNYPNYQLDAIVLPVYIILSPANWQNHLFAWEILGPDKLLGKTVNGQKLITGMGHGESDDLFFELEGYDDDYFISNTIYFEIKDSLAKSMKEKKIYFLYFNEGGLKKLEL